MRRVYASAKESTLLVTCRICGKEHDLQRLEPSLQKPDAFLEVPLEERPYRTLDGKDSCAVRDIDDTWRRYFIRALMPFAVFGMDTPYSWGIWVEVTAEQSERVNELWDDPQQHLEPPFPARLANVLLGYPDSLSIVGLASLNDPANIPHFHITGPADHRLFQEQRSGVSPAQAFEWILPVYHPGVLLRETLLFSGLVC